VRRIAILVEGQTEEQFVSRVMQPYLDARSARVWLTPIVVETSRTAAGLKSRGGGTWKNYQRYLSDLMGQSHWSEIGLLIDYYAYPRDAPGADVKGSPPERHHQILKALSANYSDQRFVPGVAFHEFETWVIAAAMKRRDLLGEPEPAQALQSLVDEFGGNVELINDGPRTAPSKRVLEAWPRYSKIRDGVELIAEAGLDSVADRCPTPADWLDRLSLR
jgi:Domain of unknown function (DUF4276)